MPTVDFVPVAIASGSNVESQADYLADPLLGSGNLPGVAKSAFNNKAIRQSSYMAAALANYLANITGSNVNDNGDPAFAAMLATMAEVFPGRKSSFTPSWTGSTSAPAIGSPTLNAGFMRRVADVLEIDYSLNYSAATGLSAGSGVYLFTLPNSLAIDTTKIGAAAVFPASPLPASSFPSLVGHGQISYLTVVQPVGVFAYSTTELAFIVQTAANYNSSIYNSTNFVWSTTAFNFTFKAQVPISGW